MPPCTSFDDFDDVPDAKSPLSTSAMRSPRDAASSATPVPVMPPPTTSTSNGLVGEAADALGAVERHGVRLLASTRGPARSEIAAEEHHRERVFVGRAASRRSPGCGTARSRRSARARRRGACGGTRGRAPRCIAASHNARPDAARAGAPGRIHSRFISHVPSAPGVMPTQPVDPVVVLGDEERAAVQVAAREIVELGNQREDHVDVLADLFGGRDHVLAHELGAERDVGGRVAQPPERAADDELQMTSPGESSSRTTGRPCAAHAFMPPAMFTASKPHCTSCVGRLRRAARRNGTRTRCGG